MARALSGMKRALLGAAVAIGMAGVAQAESLTDALVAAYKHSGLLEQNRALLRAADEDVAIAVAALRPVINYSYSIERTFGDSSRDGRFAATDATVGISAELVLFDGGASKLAIDAQKETVLATRQGLRSIEQRVLLRAATAYMNVRRQAAVVQLRQSNLRLLTQELRAARDRFDVGEVTRTDVAIAESRLASSRSQLSAAQGDLVQAQEEFRNAVGRRPGALAAPRSVPRTANTPDEAKSVARRGHPDIRRAQHQVSAAELNVLRGEAAMKPNVTLRGRYGVSERFDSDTFTNSGSISIDVTGPIYQGGRLSALVRQAMARRDADRSNLHIVRHDIDQDVGNAFSALAVVRANRTASAEQVRAATVAFRGVREEATLGARTTLDVLDAEQELLDARFDQISAEVDEYIAAYQLLSAMGLLTADKLNLPVQRYDPAAYYNLVKDAPVPVTKQGQALDRVLKSLGKE